MVKLTATEIEWLGAHYPQLIYEDSTATISGRLDFCCSYKNKTISDSYSVRIFIGEMADRQELPKVYNPDNRILKMAKRKKMSSADFHLNNDGTLCLMLPERFSQFYPNGLKLSLFLKHLENHFFWISYFDRYEEEPWPGEKHGEYGRLDYLIENPQIIVEDSTYLELFRASYKKKSNKGICKSKLKRKLLTTSLAKWIIYG